MPPTLTARQPRPAFQPANRPRGASPGRIPTASPRPASPLAARASQPRPKSVRREPPAAPKLRVALVCDWLTGGGAELVVEQLHKMFPDAPIYTSQASRTWRERLDGKVKTGFLQWWPLPVFKKFTPLLRVLWFSRLSLQDYDLVISCSGAEAKGIRVPASTLHINYCHAPTHYYWSRYREYMNSPGTGMFKHLSRLGLKTLVKPMRRWDYKAAQRPDFIIANSTHTKQEIRKYYDRTATVIYPPVAIERFRARASNTKRRGFIVSGRQTPYKRFDLAVIACTKLGLPLTVIGDGPEHRHLRKLAGKTVTFLGAVSDPVLEEEFASAKAMLFPQVEDFGITGVEALAAGTPVIAYRGGGAADYVAPGETGVLFDEQTVSGLARGLREFSKMSFNGTELSRRAERFSRQQFRRSMRAYIKRALQETKHNTSAA